MWPIKKMPISDAETLGLGSGLRLELPSPNSTSIEETLTSESKDLKLEEKAETKSEEDEEKAEDEPSAAGNLVATGWDEEIIQETSWDREIIQECNQVKGNNWGWDQEFTESSEGNQKKDFEPSVDEKFDGWGWDQENGGGDENVRSKEEKGQKNWFPFRARSNEPDCANYMKMGTRKYGVNRKFNHPPSKTRGKVNFRNPSASVQAVELNGNGTSSVMAGQDHENAYRDNKRGFLSESNGQMDCKYYSMPGGCKYGSACKYNHKEKTEVPAELNFMGLPLRPGEKECTHYMSTGSCKFSTNCRFHHPDPIAVGGQGPSGYQNGGSQPYASPAQLPMAPWPLQRNPNEPIPYLEPSPSYVTGYYLPPQGLHANPEWNGYQAPVNPVFPAEMNMLQPPSASTMKDTSHKRNFSAPKKALDAEYPERPGQADCQYFMKTGSCKFKSACKYHHPKSRMSKTSAEVNLSIVSLPLRPDQPTCTHFSRHGICKYGRSCRYNHPMDSSPSAPPASQIVFKEGEVTNESSPDPVQESDW